MEMLPTKAMSLFHLAIPTISNTAPTTKSTIMSISPSF